MPPAQRAPFCVLTDFELCMWISDYALAIRRGQERCGRFLSERELDSYREELWMMELEREQRRAS